MVLLDENSVRTIFVQIIIVVLGWLTQYINSKLVSEKQWKNIKDKSSQDKFTEYFLKAYFWGLILLIICVFVILYIEIFFGIRITKFGVEIIYVTLCIISYTYLAIKRKPKEIVFKKSYKYKQIYAYVMDKVAIGICCLSWTIVFVATEFLSVIAVMIVVFEIIYLTILDAERKYKYKYAKFVFYNRNVIDEIQTKNIMQRGNWIVVTDEIKQSEYRFRVKDVESVEYSN